MTTSERLRERAKARRKSAALESDEGGCGQWAEFVKLNCTRRECAG